MNKPINNLLVIRFSALGDVAMTVPVLYSLAKQNPSMHITMLSKKGMAPMFKFMPSNVDFWGVDLKNDYKGIGGLNKLFGEIRNRQFDAVADMHDVLRTMYIRLRCNIGGITVAHINKGRKDKKALVANGANSGKVLDSSFIRYKRVLAELGINVDIKFNSILEDIDVAMPTEIADFIGQKETKWIGIAPFAAHQGKIYPLQQMQEVANILAGKGYKVFLFGAGNEETAILEKWEQTNIVSTAGKMKGMANELLLMSKLDTMVSMDSANMHLASLVGTRVVSIWGATHPSAGFMGWNQKQSDAMQLDLPCRPCSIYGNKQCKYNDNQYKCLCGIKPQDIVAKIECL